MTPVEGLLYGLSLAITPENLVACVIGVLAGTIVGMLPGLGPSAGAAILLPFTFSLGPTASLIIVAGVYYGVMYGGSTTAILLNIPGEAPSVVSGFDGYPLAKMGRAGPALFIVVFASLIGGTVAVLLTTFATPLVARVGIAFGPAEYFALAFGGLLVLARVTGGSVAAGFIPLGLGLALATVGEDTVSGTVRFAGGSIQLSRGIGIVAVAIGLFGIAEILSLAKKGYLPQKVDRIRVRELVPTRADLRASIGPILRGAPLGFGFGLLPGPSATLATFGSYRLENAIASDKSRFGKGDVRGLAGPEAANNAAATAGIIPVLALGLPFTATLSLMLTALIVQGVQPGPLLIANHPEIFWAVIGSLYVGNVLLVILNIPLIGVWVSFLRTPYHLLIPIISVVAVIGAYAERSAPLDLGAVLALGALGYLFNNIGYANAPFLVGFILGGIIERSFRQALTISQGDLTYLFLRPLAGAIWLCVLLGLGAVSLNVARSRRRRRSQSTARQKVQ